MLKKKSKPKIIVIAGPTASGKTSFSVQLAKKFNGEVVSADSRQVYRKLDIGTEKVTKREMRGVPHHLMDVASPRRAFSVTRYKQLAEKAVESILKRGKMPIIAGGTGLYIDSVVYDRTYPEVKPNIPLRKSLEKKTEQELYAMLKKLDSRRAKDVDPKNKRRLVRAIEIAKQLGGGGHKLAAGFILKMGLEEAEKLVLETIRKQIK